MAAAAPSTPTTDDESSTAQSPVPASGRPTNRLEEGLQLLDDALATGAWPNNAKTVRQVFAGLSEQLDYWAGDIANHADGLQQHHGLLKLASSAVRDLTNKASDSHSDMAVVENTFQAAQVKVNQVEQDYIFERHEDCEGQIGCR